MTCPIMEAPPSQSENQSFTILKSVNERYVPHSTVQVHYAYLLLLE